MNNLCTTIKSEYSKLWETIKYNQNAGYHKSVFGDIFVGIIADNLANMLIKKGLKIYQGQILDKKNKLSPQVDIIIASDFVFKCNFTNTAIVRSKDVKAVIEVKAYLDKTKFLKTIDHFKKLNSFINKAVITAVITKELHIRTIPTINFNHLIVLEPDKGTENFVDRLSKIIK